MIEPDGRTWLMDPTASERQLDDIQMMVRCSFWQGSNPRQALI
jgi:hypothetical protein